MDCVSRYVRTHLYVYVDFVRIEDGCVPTVEFTEEMDELFFWLDETENIINSNVKPADDEAIEDLLQKVKVSVVNFKLTMSFVLNYVVAYVNIKCSFIADFIILLIIYMYSHASLLRAPLLRGFGYNVVGRGPRFSAARGKCQLGLLKST